jgi:hypothetical protein
VARHSRKHVEQLAHGLLVRVGATRPEHIDPIKSAQALDLEVTFGHLPGATARVCRQGSRARIRVSDEIVLPGRRRFSIAHEIGHYLLGHAVASADRASSWARTACDQRPRHEEREADIFAVAHNMPEAMVRAHCALSPANLYTSRAIAATFQASPVASALRLVDLSPEACAAVYSADGRVQWMKRSKSFPFRLAYGTKLDPESLAFTIFASSFVQHESRPLHLSTWFGSRSHHPLSKIVEHAEMVPEPGWGGVLSVLSYSRSKVLHRTLHSECAYLPTSLA